MASPFQWSSELRCTNAVIINSMVPGAKTNKGCQAWYFSKQQEKGRDCEPRVPLKEIIKVRKQQKEAALKAAKERADQMRLIMFAVPTVGIPFIILIIVAIAIISN